MNSLKLKRIIFAAFVALSFVFVAAHAAEPGGVVSPDHQARGDTGVLSGTITAGGVSQVGLGSNQFRRYLLIQNPSTAGESLFIATGSTAASATTVELLPGQSLVFETAFLVTAAVNVFAATTGHRFTFLVG